MLCVVYVETLNNEVVIAPSVWSDNYLCTNYIGNRIIHNCLMHNVLKIHYSNYCDTCFTCGFWRESFTDHLRDFTCVKMIISNILSISTADNICFSVLG